VLDEPFFSFVPAPFPGKEIYGPILWLAVPFGWSVLVTDDQFQGGQVAFTGPPCSHEMMRETAVEIRPIESRL
jgi:hypothetical protein